MKFFLLLIAFFFLLFTTGIAVFVWKVRRRIINLRDAMRDQMDDETFRRMADKNYYRHRVDNGPQFEDDYFTGEARNSTQQQQAQQQTQQQAQSRRTTRTSNGVTIIDSRDPSVANQKIFGKDEGEYVDFQEA